MVSFSESIASSLGTAVISLDFAHGLDTAKSVFQIHGVNEAGKAELKRNCAGAS
jgi:hypothetical protein